MSKPKMKKIRVREAKERDVGLFNKLWRAYLEEQHAIGNIILPSDRNVELYSLLFDSYVDKTLPEELQQDGVVLFISDVAVIMWGFTPQIFETSLGKKVACGWGIYVDPEYRGKGLADALHRETIKRLKAMDFDVIIGGTLIGDDHALESLERGTVPEGGPQVMTETPMYMKLK